MPSVEGRQWEVASEYQYYAFLIDIVNKKVKSGESIVAVLEDVVNDSTTWGHYYNSKGSTRGKNFELTGSRRVCEFYDLVNTFKILKCSNKKAVGFWCAGGHCVDSGYARPLAYLNYTDKVDVDNNKGVAILVL